MSHKVAEMHMRSAMVMHTDILFVMVNNVTYIILLGKLE